MTIIAESGASKTDWMIDGRLFRTRGINFSVMTAGDIESVVACIAARAVSPDAGSAGVSIHFYGAGLVSGEHCSGMAAILEKFFPGACIECASDLMAAARALWGNCPGVVAILGTGSNSCSYDGSKITGNVRPGGYILGDEGGGAALGKRFLSDYIKELVPPGLSRRFMEEYRLGYADIVNSVYKGPNPAGFLASFAPFIIEAAASDRYAESLVRENIDSFVTRSLLGFRKEGESLEAGVAGSIGAACRKWLEEAGQEYGISFVRFIPSPIEALVRYHSGKSPIFAG